MQYYNNKLQFIGENYTSPSAPFIWLLLQYRASLVAVKIFLADVSCRTGLLLTDAFALSKQQAATGFDAPLALLAKSNKSQE